jgi:hypothetical protein
MNSTAHNLSRSEKLILFLYEKGDGRSAKVRYEDIVVGIFKKYPHDFHLKDYPEYPDSGDMIHKPLYDSKKKGYLNAANKVFALTDRGIEYAKQLSESKTGPELISKDRLSRNTGIELARIKNLEGFELFTKGEIQKLTDNDFYDYLGVTVRTQKNAIMGRLDTLEAVYRDLKEHDDNAVASKVVEYHEFLMSKNQDVLKFLIA